MTAECPSTLCRSTTLRLCGAALSMARCTWQCCSMSPPGACRAEGMPAGAGGGTDDTVMQAPSSRYAGAVRVLSVCGEVIWHSPAHASGMPVQGGIHPDHIHHSIGSGHAQVARKSPAAPLRMLQWCQSRAASTLALCLRSAAQHRRYVLSLSCMRHR